VPAVNRDDSDEDAVNHAQSIHHRQQQNTMGASGGIRATQILDVDQVVARKLGSFRDRAAIHADLHLNSPVLGSE
jgi:hypothetical protein